MKILVINTGSSSIKYQLIDLEDEEVLSSGLVEKIGSDNSVVKHKYSAGPEGEKTYKINQAIADHRAGLEIVADLLSDKTYGTIENPKEIDAVGHRVVHGGEMFHQPAVIDDKIIKAIKDNIPLAPLHNPANLTGIEVAQAIFSSAVHVAVFDTAFHQSMPDYSYMYAIPYEMYEKHRIRKYGFHGTSHHYVALETARHLGKRLEELKIITVHLGNGSSMTAVQNGKSIDTTMGMTPLAGLIMGTRCGDLDPAVPFFLAENNSCTIERIDTMLNKKSGLFGICGKNDMREIHEQIATGCKKSKLALNMLTNQIRKYLGAYIASMNGCDAIVFTAGIGENDDEVRAGACTSMDFLGIEIDHASNSKRQEGIRDISGSNSKIKVLIIPTNEELQIARETAEVIEKK